MNDYLECIVKIQNGIEVGYREELIRCKDCKHYRINTVYPGTNMIMTYCAKIGIAENKPDWFCADGKEK